MRPRLVLASLVLTGFVLLSLFWPGAIWAQAAGNETAGNGIDTGSGYSPESSTPVILVGFEPDVAASSRLEAMQSLGAEHLRDLPQLHVVQFHLSPGHAAGNSLEQLLVWADAHPAVRFVEFDESLTLSTGPAITLEMGPKTYGLVQVEAPAAWHVTQGREEMLIAILDTGLRQDHPKFAGRVLAGFDFVDEDADPSDISGHGTHVAGIAAAALDGVEMAGLCPRCSLMPVRVLQDDNTGSISTVAQGIVYAVDQGAQIISLSLGTPIPSPTLERAIAYAHSRNVLIVAAAGNQAGEAPFYPAAWDEVLGVAATDAANQLWASSNYGINADVAAPGRLIYSTYHELDNAFGGYMYLSGTSMAAPHVAGLAGLLWSHSPHLSPTELRAILTSTGDPVAFSPHPGLTRINAPRALAQLDSLPPQPEQAGAFALFVPTILHEQQ